MLWIKFPVSLVVAACMLPQVPATQTVQGYAVFAAVLGGMLTALEIAKRILDARGEKKHGNGVGTALRQIAHTMSRIESGLNASTTALALLQHMHEQEQREKDALARCIGDIQQHIASVKQNVDQLVA